MVKFLFFNWAPRQEGVWGSEGIAPRVLMELNIHRVIKIVIDYKY
jgi:hypothetical protein